MGMARFSVIVPVKNGERYIHRCLESILKQTYNDYEIIVILNGCSDNSLSILQRFVENDDRIRIISTDISGVSNARNLGLEIARGDIITFVDIDDYVAPNYLESIESSFIAYPNADAVVFNYYTVYRSVPEKQCILPDSQVVSGRDLVALFFDDRLKISGYCWNKAIKRECVSNVKFDTNYFMGEDLDFIAKVFYEFNYVVINHDCLYYYCINHDSATEKVINRGEKNSLRLHADSHLGNFVDCYYGLYLFFSSKEGPCGVVAEAIFKVFSFYLVLLCFFSFVEKKGQILEKYIPMRNEMLIWFRRYYKKKYRMKYVKTKVIIFLTNSKVFLFPAKIISHVL